MKHYDGYRYDYVVNKEAYYASVMKEPDSIQIHRSHVEGGCAWKFSMTRRNLGGGTLELKMFGDAWQAFGDAPELFEVLRKEQVRTLGELRTVLDALGFTDITQRESPNQSATEDEAATLTADVVVLRRDSMTGHYSVLLTERAGQPFRGALALPGGEVERGEPVEDAAVRELHEETGLMVDPDDLMSIGVYASPDRDPRGRYVSFAYAVVLPPEQAGKARPGDDAVALEWASVTSVVEGSRTLAFDHNRITAEALGMVAVSPHID